MKSLFQICRFWPRAVNRAHGSRSASRFLLDMKSNASAKTPMAALGTSFSTRSSSTNSALTPSQHNTDMFCRQCEQTSDHYACVTQGICGKTSETAACQDTLIHQIKSVSHWAKAARENGATEQDLYAANRWTLQAAFSTLTNVNFSDERISQYVREGETVKNHLKTVVNNPPKDPIASFQIDKSSEIDIEEFGHTVSIPNQMKAMNHVDAFSLKELATYGLKGACAYAAHCDQLGVMDEDIMKEIHEIFVKLSSDEADLDGLLETVMKVGSVNGKVLAALDGAHARNFGDPEPSPVRVTAVEGKAILVSGHDLADLKALLEQTEGKGINVYTHGEMLPAHAYPELKKYPHLIGNYGTAWQNQKFEFAAFPGPIVVTTNCVLEPRRMYKERLYTINEVGLDGVKHVQNRDFSAVIEDAEREKGFPRTIEPAGFITTGFNHRAVLPLAESIIEAANNGSVSRIFLIGGCDGSQWDRSYFTDLAEETPEDSLILTLGCAKNRVIHSEKLLNARLTNGLPRVLDMGQCNDAYSAIVVAQELAKALNCSVNDLPLSLALSHLEQKACAVLLTLLSMGVKNIRLGPSLPAYITPNVMNILSGRFNLMPTGNFQEDLAKMMDGN